MRSDTEKYIREIRNKLKKTTNRTEIQLLRDRLLHLKEILKKERASK